MLNILLVGIGVIIFIVSIVIYFLIFFRSKALGYKPFWYVLIIFVLFFLLGYVVFELTLIYNYQFHNFLLLISLIFFFGAIFVALTALLFYLVIMRLKAYNDNLEELVKKRTKKLEEAHKRTIAKEKEIQKLKDQFVFVAAHELRSPINAIRWNLEMLFEEGDTKKLSSGSKDMLTDIQKSNRYLIDLIEDLLNVSRMDYGTFKVEVQDIKAEDQIKEAIKTLEVVAKGSGISLSFASGSKKFQLVKADPKRVKEVLINLINNAIKYNKKGGFVKVETEVKDKFLEIRVIDNGIGIEKKDMSKLFKKFSRIENDNTAQITGTGLGLFISKQIIEKMGGKIKAESPGRGKGSTFKINLPLK